MEDLFESIEKLPIEAQEIISKYSENDVLSKEQLDEFQEEIWKVGYTFDYGLDMIPSELRELTMLDKATDKITIEMLKGLGYGEQISLNEKYDLYHYMDEDIIVLSEADGEEEEVYQIMYDENGIQFEAL